MCSARCGKSEWPRRMHLLTYAVLALRITATSGNTCERQPASAGHDIGDKKLVKLAHGPDTNMQADSTMFIQSRRTASQAKQNTREMDAIAASMSSGVESLARTQEYGYSSEPEVNNELFVAIISKPDHFAKRKNVRDAVLLQMKEKYDESQILPRFVIGHDPFPETKQYQGILPSAASRETEEKLKLEQEEFGDIVRIPLPEEYNNLPDKTLLALDLGLRARYRFIMKIDDDMLLNPEKALAYFHTKDPMSLLYVGRHLWEKQYYKTQIGADNKFTPYMGGPAYALSYSLARLIALEHKDYAGSFLSYASSSEDVMMGKLVEAEKARGAEVIIETQNFATPAKSK